MDLEIFNIPRGWLKFTGIWVLEDSSQIYRRYAFVMQLVFLYLWLTLMGAAVVDMRNLIEISEVLTYFVTYFVCVIKCINFYRTSTDIVKLLNTLKKSIQDFELPETYFSLHFPFVKVLLFTYWFAAFSTCAVSGFAPFFNGKLSFHMWFPYDTSKTGWFYLSAMYQLTEIMCYASANVMLDSLSILVFTYCITMLSDLCDRLEGLKRHRALTPGGGVNEMAKVDNFDQLLTCINYQRKIVELVRETEAIFGKVIALQGCLSTVVLCTSIFALTMLSFPDDLFLIFKFATYIMAMIWQIIIPCYYGTLLSMEYDKVVQSIFHSEWYFEDAKFRKAMSFFIENAKRPFKLTAFFLYDISLNTFGRILNSAYSLYAVFKRVN